ILRAWIIPGVLLAADVGNTQSHMGLFEGDELVQPWRFATRVDATADELAVGVSTLLGLRGLEAGTVDGTIVSSVVPQLTAEYLGGVIGPGVEISMEALAQRTAKLPPIELGEPPSEAGGVIGRSTHQSLLSGITYGFAGAVDAIAGRIQRELGSDVRFVATG